MAFSVAPDLIDAIVAAAQDAMPNVVVSDGFATTSDPGAVLMVGVEDPFSDTDEPAVDSEADFATTGRDGIRQESGEIVCAAYAWTGDPDDQKTPRVAVYDVADEVEALCRIQGGTDPAFGVERALWTKCGTRGQLRQLAGESGRAALLIFRIYYEGRP